MCPEPAKLTSSRARQLGASTEAPTQLAPGHKHLYQTFTIWSLLPSRSWGSLNLLSLWVIPLLLHAPSQQSFQQPRTRKHSRCRNCSMTNIFHSQLNPNQQVSAELLARTSSQHWLLQQVNRFWIWITLGYLAVTGTTNAPSLSAAGWAQSREQQASAPAPPPAWFTGAHVLSSLNRHLIEICFMQTVQRWNISDETGIPADTGFKTLLLKHILHLQWVNILRSWNPQLYTETAWGKGSALLSSFEPQHLHASGVCHLLSDSAVTLLMRTFSREQQQWP